MIQLQSIGLQIGYDCNNCYSFWLGNSQNFKSYILSLFHLPVSCLLVMSWTLPSWVVNDDICFYPRAVRVYSKCGNSCLGLVAHLPIISQSFPEYLRATSSNNPYSFDLDYSWGFSIYHSISCWRISPWSATECSGVLAKYNGVICLVSIFIATYYGLFWLRISSFLYKSNFSVVWTLVGEGLGAIKAR